MKKKKNMLGPIVLLSTISLVSVGFASWVLTAGDEVTFEGGNLQVETVNDYTHSLEVFRIRGIEDSEHAGQDLLRKDNVDHSDGATAASASYTNEFVAETNLQKVGQKDGGGWDVNYASNRAEVLRNYSEDSSSPSTLYDDDHNVESESMVTRSLFTDVSKTTYVDATDMTAAGKTPAWTLAVDGDPREDILFYFYVKVTNVSADEDPEDILGEHIAGNDATSTVLTITDNSDATYNYAAAKNANYIATPEVSYADFGNALPNDGTHWYTDSDSSLTPAQIAEDGRTRAVIVKVKFAWGTTFDSKNPMDYVLDQLKAKINNVAEYEEYYEDKNGENTWNEATVCGYVSSEAFAENEALVEQYGNYEAYKTAKINAAILNVNREIDADNRKVCGDATTYFDALEKDLEGVSFKLTFTAGAKPQA